VTRRRSRCGPSATALREGEAEDVAPLCLGGTIGGIDGEDEVAPPALPAQHVQGRRVVAGGDDAVGDLASQEVRGRQIDRVAQGDDIPEGRHPVGPARPRVGGGEGGELQIRDERRSPGRIVERHRARRARRADVLERGRGREAGRRAQLAHQLPAVERVEQVDVAGVAVEDRERERCAVSEQPGRCLVRIHPVAQG